MKSNVQDIEMRLSRKILQLQSLQAITQSINYNVPAESLFAMYATALSFDCNVKRFVYYSIVGDKWECRLYFDSDEAIKSTDNQIDSVVEEKDPLKIERFKDFLVQITGPKLFPKEHPLAEKYYVIIPVIHKKYPIAYVFLGGLDSTKDDFWDKIQYITTVTNIIAVAIENKRLFKLQLKQERLNREIELATEVQKMLIPDVLPFTPKYHFASIYKPHFNVGGDYIDIFKISDTKFAFCIADISGKGVAAAMLMANFQAIIQSLIYQFRDLETFIIALNDAVIKITKMDKFITFFVGEVDLTTMKIKYVNAGHLPPILTCGNKIVFLDKGTTVIGAESPLPFINEEIVDISNDSMIFCYTDGLIDLINNKGKYFDDELVLEFVKQNKNLNAFEFNQKLMSVIENFRSNMDYPDDIAILTCKFTIIND